MVDQHSLIPLELGIFGVLSGFLYLRFFKAWEGRHGDHSASFIFANMFPGILRYPMVKISGWIFRLAILLDCSGRLRSWTEEMPSGPSTLLPRINLKPSSNFDVERRRYVQLKSLILFFVLEH